MPLTLVIGNKNYSSWSMRAALVLDLAEVAYEELRIPLYRQDSRALLMQHSPTGKVPVLLTEEGPVWDSLAIAEYLAEACAESHLWPRGEYARAVARSVCAEMHAGFAALRSQLPMDLRRKPQGVALSSDSRADIDRVCSIWADCRQRFGADGDYLFGHASIADAFYAPVAARLRGYAVPLPAVAAEYVDTIHRWPAFQRWYQAALQETETIG